MGAGVSEKYEEEEEKMNRLNLPKDRAQKPVWKRCGKCGWFGKAHRASKRCPECGEMSLGGGIR